MARPGDQKPRSEKRRANERLSKRVTMEELVRFEIRAEIAGFQNAQEFLSAFILGEVAGIRVSKKDLNFLRSHLGMIGSNLNQITKKLNQGRKVAVTPADLQVIETVRDAVQAVRSEIREYLG